MSERHVVRYRGSRPPEMLRSEARDAGLTVREPVETRGWEPLVDAAIGHGVVLVLVGAQHVVQALLKKWKEREPDADIDWREQDGYR